MKQEASANGIVSTHDQILDKFPEGTESRGFRIRVLPYFWSMGDFTKNLSVSLISQSSKQFVDVSLDGMNFSLTGTYNLFSARLIDKRKSENNGSISRRKL